MVLYRAILAAVNPEGRGGRQRGAAAVALASGDDFDYKSPPASLDRMPAPLASRLCFSITERRARVTLKHNLRDLRRATILSNR